MSVPLLLFFKDGQKVDENLDTVLGSMICPKMGACL